MKLSTTSTIKPKDKLLGQSGIKKVLIFYVLSFVIPLILNPNPTTVWFTGIAVNCTLISACFYLNKTSLIPLAMIPSIGMATRGIASGFLIFGQLTFLPFIWIANLVFIFLFKTFAMEKNINPSLALIVSAIAKVFLLFTSAYMMYSINSLSQVFLNAMGFMQIVTALVGGFLALGICLFRTKS